MTIRPFEAADTEAVVRLWEACGLVRPVNDPRMDIARKLRVDPDLFLVGVEGAAVVAAVMAGYEGHRGAINYLAVDPGRRRRGLGRQLMAEAERRLRARGCPKINLMVRTTNREVLGFYAALGFAADDVVCLGRRLEPDGPAPSPAG